MLRTRSSCSCGKKNVTTAKSLANRHHSSLAARRLQSVAEKRRIVAETVKPGTSVSVTARTQDVNVNLVFGWRKLCHATAWGNIATGAAWQSTVTRSGQDNKPGPHSLEMFSPWAKPEKSTSCVGQRVGALGCLRQKQMGTAQVLSRSDRRNILPTLVLGNSVRNSINFGTL